MSFWDIVNSPVILTLVTLIWGSLVASWVTALWQKRSHHHEVKLKYAQEVTSAYQEYIRMIRSNLDRLSGKDFDDLHSHMVSQARIAGFLFRDKRIGQSWQTVIDKLASVRALRVEGRDPTLIERKLREVYEEADKAVEGMFKKLV
ncbi:MAG: hypothetical protein DRI81_19695 [Chloroflexi bacterium]|nr:MAG: hypothetical protein DRI81_19695 [Chloroflexota bacterium]